MHELDQGLDKLPFFAYKCFECVFAEIEVVEDAQSFFAFNIVVVSDVVDDHGRQELACAGGFDASLVGFTVGRHGPYLSKAFRQALWSLFGFSEELGDLGFADRGLRSRDPLDAVRSVQGAPSLEQPAESVVWGDVRVRNHLLGDGAGVVLAQE